MREYEKVPTGQINFWDFTDIGNETFEGKFIEHYKHFSEEGQEIADWESLKFEDEKGVEWFLPTHYALMKAIELKGKGFYKIVFLREEKIKGGKTVKHYSVEFSKE